MKPLISIITITYNSEESILRTLDSINSQTFQDFEYIVIDGKSSDKTIDIINDHKIKINKLISEKDNGIYDALNKGIKESNGKYIGFLHSDDKFYSKDSLKSIVDSLIENDSDIIYGDLKYVSKGPTYRVIRKWVSGSFKRYKLHLGWMPPHPTLYMKKSLYKKNGVFNTNLKISADYDLMTRNFSKQNLKITYLKRYLVLMTLGGESNKNINNLYIALKEDIFSMRTNKIFWPLALIFKKLSKIKQFI
jgi:glycosyltransferase